MLDCVPVPLGLSNQYRRQCNPEIDFHSLSRSAHAYVRARKWVSTVSVSVIEAAYIFFQITLTPSDGRMIAHPLRLCGLNWYGRLSSRVGDYESLEHLIHMYPRVGTVEYLVVPSLACQFPVMAVTPTRAVVYCLMSRAVLFLHITGLNLSVNMCVFILVNTVLNCLSLLIWDCSLLERWELVTSPLLKGSRLKTLFVSYMYAWVAETSSQNQLLWRALTTAKLWFDVIRCLEE